MKNQFKLLIILFFFLVGSQMVGRDYFVHPNQGSDDFSGLTKSTAFKTLKRASKINFEAGDRLVLASGEIYFDQLEIVGISGTSSKTIHITTEVWDDKTTFIPALINFKGFATGILLENSSYVQISKIHLTADGYTIVSHQTSTMRCGILIKNSLPQSMTGITVSDVKITKVFYENIGFARGKNEVKTANGTQKYGWGIRVINEIPDGKITALKIENSHIEDVGHTGIKLSGISKNIVDIIIENNKVLYAGGPGIQMSGVKDVLVTNNLVSHSGSDNDTRKWGRGSGLWTWDSSNVLIEHNKFLNANGPGDSAGAHIDFNCDNIILQYNLSAYNAGGFCEILGNNYNCAYRYNVSINDGHRIKGVDGAFQEGKILWLSGYQGEKKERKGPVNSYIYNNTIYSDSSIVAKIAIDNSSKGILIANNIFYLKGESKAVLGDQYKPDTAGKGGVKNVVFKNNVYLDNTSWPANTGIEDSDPIYGNPDFLEEKGNSVQSFVPQNIGLIKNKGITIELLPGDQTGLLQSLHLKKDILGNNIGVTPSIGAIELN